MEEEESGWSLVSSHLVLLVVMSCILSLLFGGLSTGRPFAGDEASWRWLFQVIFLASMIALIPVIVMFLLSSLLGALTQSLDAKRSFRDGLAAAWFFILATNYGMWMASDITSYGYR